MADAVKCGEKIAANSKLVSAMAKEAVNAGTLSLFLLILRRLNIIKSSDLKLPLFRLTCFSVWLQLLS